MISALLYLQGVSIRNRLVTRFKRLKQPKYLAGAIAGLAYFYFYFFRFLLRSPGGNRSALGAAAPETLFFYESLGAAAFLVIILLAWLIPHERAALTFSEAEVAFLFPAPITRRGLIHFKLLRSQTSIFFTVLILTLITSRFGGKAWIHAAGLWFILSTMNLHFLGSSLGRNLLLDRGITPWRRRMLIIAFLLVVAACTGIWLKRSLPALNASGMQNLQEFSDYLRLVLTSGPLPYLLYPFKLIIRPYLAQNLHAFLLTAGPALGIVLVHYAWVVRSNVSFEDGSIEASRKLAEKVAAVRSGNWHGAARTLKVKRAPFALAPNGPKPVAFLWKNLISAGQGFSPRIWIVLAIMVVVVGFSMGQGFRHSGFWSIGLTICGVLLTWSLMLGPQLLRHDLRQDLPLMDVLKLYPVKGWQVVLGELLAPSAILAGIQWLLLVLSAICALNMKASGLTLGRIASVGVAAALVLPMMDLVILLIPNAAVLIFPGWFQLGKDGPHGIEATGQRLIFMLGQLLAFVLSLLPATVVFGLVFFGINFVTGWLIAVPLAAMAAAITLAGEAALGTLLLGSFFERFDLSSELH